MFDAEDKMYDFKSIIKNFELDGNFVSCERYGEGHINQTFLLTLEKDGGKTDYILQRINNNLFTNVDKLMQNIMLVTEFNRQKIIKNGGNPKRLRRFLV